MVQKKQMESTAQDHIHEMAKPMARYRDDKDLDAMLKEQDREGDPMLAFLKKKQAKLNEKLGIKGELHVVLGMKKMSYVTQFY